MARYSITLTDQFGGAIPGALATVVSSGTNSVPVLTDDAGNMLGEPLRTDVFGALVFNAPDDFYDIAYYYGGRKLRVDNRIAIGVPVEIALVNASISILLPPNSVTRTALFGALPDADLATIVASVPPRLNTDGTINPVGSSFADDQYFFKDGMFATFIRSTLGYSQTQMDALFANAATYPNPPATDILSAAQLRADLASPGGASRVNFSGLSASDPGVAGAPWNNGGFLAISNGTPAS